MTYGDAVAIRIFRRDRDRRDGITVLDQGRSDALVRLKAEGNRSRPRGAFAQWWDDMPSRLGASLDVIHLAGRHRTRSWWIGSTVRAQHHRAESRPADEAHGFLARYRLASRVRSARWRPRDPEVLRYDTERTSTAQLTSTIQPILIAQCSSRSIARPSVTANRGEHPASMLRVLHVILMLGETNSQYNEQCSPVDRAALTRSARTSCRV